MHWLLRVLEAEKSKIKVPTHSLPGEGLLLACRWPPSLMSSGGRYRELWSLLLLQRHLSHYDFTLLPSSKHNQFPKALPPNIIT